MELEKNNPEKILEEIRQVFQKRELEFQKREESYEKRKQQTQKLLEALTEQKKDLENMKSRLEQKSQRLEEQEQQQNERLKEIERREQALNEQTRLLEEKEKDLYVEQNLEIEKVRNEQMKLQRLTDEYEYKISLVDNGIFSDPKEESSSFSISDSNKNELLEKLNKMSDEITKKDETISTLQVERRNLLQLLMEKNNNDKTEENCVQQRAETNNPQEQEEIPEEHIDQEELTAENLKRYLERNRPAFKNLQIRHSDNGEQLHADGNGLKYTFVFTTPASFDLVAYRRKSGRIRELIEKFNQKYPGVQFRYDTNEQAVYASGYFTVEMSPEELMQKVDEIETCFHLKE